jgi:hypothetical protein
MQRALSEGFYIDVERGILGIILDVEIEIRIEVVSAMTRTIRVMGWERQQPRDHDHHGSGLPEKTRPPFAAILASVDCHSVSGLILPKAATSLTSFSIFVASAMPPSQLNNFRPSNDTLMIMAPSALCFCFSLRAMARLRIARRTSAEIPAAQVPNVPHRTRELDCSEIIDRRAAW